MATTTRWLIAAALSAATAGCSSTPLYPVVGNPVNPTPVHGYRVECRTIVGMDFLLIPGAYSHCRPVLSPTGVVIRTLG